MTDEALLKSGRKVAVELRKQRTAHEPPVKTLGVRARARELMIPRPKASRDGTLPEIVERPDHPWFVGVQFHPELKSKPFDPHPLFASFVGAAVKRSRLD